MIDIVERLRKPTWKDEEVFFDAIEEIERLREVNKKTTTRLL